jgi:hypothetical protein
VEQQTAAADLEAVTVPHVQEAVAALAETMAAAAALEDTPVQPRLVLVLGARFDLSGLAALAGHQYSHQQT